MKINNIIRVILLTAIISCNNQKNKSDKTIRIFYPDGQPKVVKKINNGKVYCYNEYYPSGKIKKQFNISNGNDTIYVYYKNGTIKEKRFITIVLAP